MFYDTYEELCRFKGESPSRAAEHMGLNRATVTFWKKEGFCPRQATLSVLADYFAVPVAYLMGEPVWPCPLCGGDAATHSERHRRMRAAAATYGFCWPEGLCRKQLHEARLLLTDATQLDDRVRAVRAALNAWFSRSVTGLDFPPDHPTPAAFFGRVFWENPPEEWLTKEELTYLRDCYPLPDQTGPCRLPRGVYDEPPPAAAQVLPLPTPVNRIPVLGRIAAGNPILAAQEAEEWLPTERAAKDLFALRVKGDSMVGAGIPDGAVVILRRQSTAADGEIAACMVDGEDATLKRIRRDGAHLILCPENPAYSPRVVPLTAFETGEARILGVAVEVRTYFSPQ